MLKPVVFGIGKLGRKLTLAFLGVALTSIIVISGLTEISTGRDVNSLVAQQEDALTKQSDQLSQQMTALATSLTEQYSSLNTLLSSLQSTSSYLSQAFASLPQVQGTPTG